MSEVFATEGKVLFKHCDPAGIVFYPRYFEMMNDCVETFFDHIGHAFADLHRRGAVPTVRIEAGFPKPSRHGDMLHFALSLTQIGRTSANLRIDTTSGDEIRMTFRSTLVLVGTEGRPLPWPDDLRAALTPYLESET